MQKNKKAQAAMEFVLVFSILTIFATAFLITIYYNITQSKIKNDQDVGDDMANFIQQEIVLASRVEDGYNRTFFLPLKASGKDYDISIRGNGLFVNTTRTIAIRGVPYVQGCDKTGDEAIKFLHNANNSIIKNQTGIYINKYAG